MDKIALIVDQFGRFEVRVMDQRGNQRVVAGDESLTECLAQAARSLGHALVIPISGPDTSF